MKKYFAIIITLILVTLLIFFAIKEISKYRFGYFVEGPELKYEHRDADVLKLENGNVLILGQNAHSCPTRETCKDDIMPVIEVPSEIYNAKTNKIEELRLPNNIRYQAKGILLKNNRLLLTHAYDPSNDSYPKVKKVGELLKDIKQPYLYDSMAVVNLNTLKVERVLKKKINQKYIPDYKWTNFTLLENNKVLIIDFLNNAIEICNLESNASKILPNTKINKEFGSVVITKGKNKGLIFGPTKLPHKKYSDLKYGELDNVLEYDDATETVSTVGKVMRRDFPLIKKINNNELLIMGGDFRGKWDLREIEKYNLDSNSSEIIAKLKQERNFEITTKASSFNGALIDDRYFLIAGGSFGGKPLEITRKSTEILDLQNFTITEGPKMHRRQANYKMITLNNENILLIGGKDIGNSKKIQVFKNLKRGQINGK